MEPQLRIGLASLTKWAFDGVDLQPLRSQLITRCALDPNAQGAFMDLSVIDQLQGQRDQGLHWQARALEHQRLFSTGQPQSAQRRLLVFARPGDMGGNTPVEFLLQGAGFEVMTYYPRFDAPQVPLPDHDIAFCAAPADGPGAAQWFADLRRLARNTGTRILNLPEAPVNLDRDGLVGIFPFVPGLRVPKSLRLDRAEVMGLADDAAHFPFLLRPTGSHAGAGLARIDSVDALASYLAGSREDSFFVTEYVDYATPADGLYRKYRIVFVDGCAYPCHMAIADRWDIWYLNAEMDQAPEKRAEEAAFMADFTSDFAARHRGALAAIGDGLGLAYFGIDCAEDAQGNLVLFEADNALIVHDMDCETVFPYKTKHMHRIFEAFETMLQRRCTSGDPAQSTAFDPH